MHIIHTYGLLLLSFFPQQKDGVVLSVNEEGEEKRGGASIGEKK
jgi:hypothetical protein